MDAIRVEGLRYHYGEYLAVDGVDFTVGEGEVFAPLGTNGAGKTTTLEVVEGFRAPSAGSVRVLGRDPFAERGALAASLGVMLQESGFIGELTVVETLRLRQGLSPRGDEVERLLDLLSLTERASVAVEQLSGGERRRLDVALAVWGRPRLVVLDEPTTGLDPESRSGVWDIVRSLTAAGTTVLLTTHYLEEAEALADRVVIMHGGRVRVAGTLAEVLSSRPSRITATLPATAPPVPAMTGQVFPVRCRAGRGDRCAATGSGRAAALGGRARDRARRPERHPGLPARGLPRPWPGGPSHERRSSVHCGTEVVGAEEGHRVLGAPGAGGDGRAGGVRPGADRRAGVGAAGGTELPDPAHAVGVPGERHGVHRSPAVARAETVAHQWVERPGRAGRRAGADGGGDAGAGGVPVRVLPGDRRAGAGVAAPGRRGRAGGTAGRAGGGRGDRVSEPQRRCRSSWRRWRACS